MVLNETNWFCSALIIVLDSYLISSRDKFSNGIIRYGYTTVSVKSLSFISEDEFCADNTESPEMTTDKLQFYHLKMQK